MHASAFPSFVSYQSPIGCYDCFCATRSIEAKPFLCPLLPYFSYSRTTKPVEDRKQRPCNLPPVVFSHFAGVIMRARERSGEQPGRRVDRQRGRWETRRMERLLHRNSQTAAPVDSATGVMPARRRVLRNCACNAADRLPVIRCPWSPWRGEEDEDETKGNEGQGTGVETVRHRNAAECPPYVCWLWAVVTFNYYNYLWAYVANGS